MIFAHLSVSAAISRANSEAEPGIVMAPMSAKRAAIARSASPELMVWLSVSTMEAGVKGG
jgi:hypothetical protein